MAFSVFLGMGKVAGFRSLELHRPFAPAHCYTASRIDPLAIMAGRIALLNG
jgi:hypothetical protein